MSVSREGTSARAVARARRVDEAVVTEMARGLRREARVERERRLLTGERQRERVGARARRDLACAIEAGRARASRRDPGAPRTGRARALSGESRAAAPA